MVAKSRLRKSSDEPMANASAPFLEKKKRAAKGRGWWRSASMVVTLWGLTIMLPMITLSILLICLVLARSIENTPSDSPEFDSLINETINPGNAYYVNMNATTLLTISAWSSTLVSIFGVIMMELWSYQTASRMHQLSQNSDKLDLPSPYQLVFLLEMLKGNFAVLLSDLEYWLCWKRRKTSIVPLLKSSMSMLAIVSMMGLLIIVADTWLHLTTETVPITRSLNLANIEEYSLSSLKQFGLSPDAQKIASQIGTEVQGYGPGEDDPLPPWGLLSAGFTYGCPGDLLCWLESFGNQSFPYASPDTFQILANSSKKFTIRSASFEEQPMTFLSPLGIPQPLDDFAIDFTGSTYGASAFCTPQTAACHFDNKEGQTAAYDWEFNCTDIGSTFSYTRPKGSPIMFENHTLYSDPTCTTPMPWNYHARFYDGELFPTLNMTNPSFPAAVMISNTYSPNLDSTESPGGESGVGGGSGIVLFCNHTIFNMTYSFINGTYAITDRNVSDQVVASVANIPNMLPSLQEYYNYQINIVMTADSAQEAADAYASIYSQASLALLAKNLGMTPATTAQIRRQLLVSRVPKAPFYTLIAFNLLYVLLALGATLGALWVIRRKSEVVDIQARLGIAGLTAALFAKETLLEKQVGSSTEFFDEKKNGGQEGVGRIGLKQSAEGKGWRLGSFVDDDDG